MEIKFNKINETFYYVDAERSVLMELYDSFSFLVPNHIFHPKVKKGWWDGRIRLLNLQDQTIYTGLRFELIKFCNDNNYRYTFSDKGSFERKTKEDSIEFIKSLNIPSKFDIRDYQVDAFVKSINLNRSIILSPTSSGKTMLMYYLYRFYGLKTLIITPISGLLTQIKGDFEDYGYDVNNISYDINSKCPLTILTWQKIQHIKNQDWYDQWDVVIVDEVHQADAKQLSTIMMKMQYAIYRFGLTGTLKDAKSSTMSLIGLFGPIVKTKSTRELIDEGYLAEIKIKTITLKYNEDDRKTCKQLDYKKELDFVLNHKQRNKFISKLITSLEGNVLVLFNFKENHGIPFYELVKSMTNRPVYYISGDIKEKERDRIKEIIKNSTDSITIASVVFATGISIPSLNHLVFTSPAKAKIRSLQSIGRVLRKTKTKTNCILWDFCDDLTIHKHKNYVYKHFLERIDIYNEELFDVEYHSKKLE